MGVLVVLSFILLFEDDGDDGDDAHGVNISTLGR